MMPTRYATASSLISDQKLDFASIAGNKLDSVDRMHALRTRTFIRCAQLEDMGSEIVPFNVSMAKELYGTTATFYRTLNKITHDENQVDIGDALESLALSIVKRSAEARDEIATGSLCTFSYNIVSHLPPTNEITDVGIQMVQRASELYDTGMKSMVYFHSILTGFRAPTHGQFEIADKVVESLKADRQYAVFEGLLERADVPAFLSLSPQFNTFRNMSIERQKLLTLYTHENE